MPNLCDCYSAVCCQVLVWCFGDAHDIVGVEEDKG